MVDFKSFIGSVVKFGGANLILVLLLAWFFQTNFSVSPLVISEYIEYLYIVAFYDTLCVMVFSRCLWMAEKIRAFIKGEDTSKDVATKTPAQIAQELGFESAGLMIAKVGELKTKLTTEPKEKEKKKITKELAKIQKELDKYDITNLG